MDDAVSKKHEAAATQAPKEVGQIRAERPEEGGEHCSILDQRKQTSSSKDAYSCGYDDRVPDPTTRQNETCGIAML
jgi:hypothetical protein